MLKVYTYRIYKIVNITDLTHVFKKIIYQINCLKITTSKSLFYSLYFKSYEIVSNCLIFSSYRQPQGDFACVGNSCCRLSTVFLQKSLPF